MRTAHQKSVICLLIAVLAAAALLTGCGQKGPLYLPDDSAQAQKKKSTDTPTAP
jgi:predicted small lipoprotein YifL